MSPPEEFRIADPLPTGGTTLLEASAGTGKTWAIAALVTRYVAEGRADLEDLLVVTFGRAASAELRDRVRARLVQAEQVLASGDAPQDDALLSLLLDADAAERDARGRRLRRAVARFDEATITTTHGFCHAVLRSLGTAGDVEPGSALIEDDGDIVEEVVADLYLQAVGRGQPPPFGPDEARVLGSRAVEDPAAALLPTDAEPDSEPDLRRRFAAAVRAESARRRLAARTLSYDDLLQRLAEALRPDDSAARAVMRERWRFVLVDEFQDTDPVQWQILERAFVGHATVVLVGDPKQAIYGFRGGDVHTYLRAASQADLRRTLVLNHRSDAPLVDAVDAVLRGAQLGDAEIVVRPARAALRGSRLVDPAGDAPFRVRALTRADAGVPEGKHVPIARARESIAADVAADIAGLLTRGATYDDTGGGAGRRAAESDTCSRPVGAGDVAVLVERHADADVIHDALLAAGVPAVRGGGADVLRSDAGQHWVTLLSAMEAPHRSALVRAAALTPFFGHDAVALDAEGDVLTDVVSAHVRDLADLQRERGTAGLVEALTGDAAVTERVLAFAGGRRLLTDLEHVGHVLQRAARERGLGLSGLLRWLLDRRADGAQAADRARRLDSDAEAVQIVTTFVSKGLQYPVVYAPFLFNRWDPERDVLRLHTDGQRSLDVGGGGPSFTQHRAQASSERAGEALRLLYVAMTRAQSRLVMHWAPSWDCTGAALHRLLFRADPDDPAVPDTVGRPSDVEAVARLRQWQARGGPVVEQMITDHRSVPDAKPSATVLAARELTRDIDPTWRRTSYSSLVRRDDELSVGSEPSDVGTQDEQPVEVATAGELGPSPWSELAGGAALGTLVHAVLEGVDVTASDLPVEVRERVDEQLARQPLDVDPALLATVVADALTTPMGPFVDELTLAETLALQPLRELEFELPLGKRASTGRLGDVADLMDEHLAVEDPLRPFAGDLRDATLAGRTLHGYLNGSIDLLMRTREGRTLVVDHKTNRLEGPASSAAPGPETPSGGGLAAYAPGRLAEAMLHTTYPLQAMLYTVAQHRFLRWRMPGYDPDEHLGGVLYLFVRGMSGPDVPRDPSGAPYGVFAWRPPTLLVSGLSDLLDGRENP